MAEVRTAQFSGAFLDYGGQVWNVRHPQFGAKGDGVTDDTAALQAAINAAPSGSTILGPPGSTFLLSDELVVTGKTLTFLMYGCTIIQSTTAKRVLVYDAGLDFVRDVSSVTPSTRVVTLSDGSGVEQGDVLRLVSDDRLEGTRPANGGNDYRQGQFAVVTSVSGDDVTLNDAIRYTYTTNVRAAKLSGHTVTWRGGAVRYDTSITSQSTCFDIYNATAPIIEDVRFGYLPFIAVSLKGCYTYHVRDLAFTDSLFDAPNFGHGVSDWSCYGGEASGLGGSRVRHVFTTNVQPIPADSDDIWAYGPNYGGVVYMGAVSGFGAAAYDTHHGCEDFTFVGGNVVGRDAAAIGLRGRRITVVGLRSHSSLGALVQSEETLDPSDYSEDITFVGCEFMRCSGTAANVRRVNRARFVNCTFDRAGDLRTIQVDEGSVEFVNARIRADGTAGDNAYLVLVEDAPTVSFLGTTTIEIAGNAGATPRLFAFSGADAGTVTASDIRLTVDASVDDLIIARNGASSGDGTVKIERMDVDGPTTLTRTSGDFTAASFFTYTGTVSPDSTNPDNTISHGQIVTFNLSGSAHVLQVVNAEGSVSVGGFAAGKYPGQMVTLYSRAGSNAITIPNGEGSNGVTIRNFANIDVVLDASRDVVTYIWAGSTYQWVQIGGVGFQ